jgi:hypothetical protein
VVQGLVDVSGLSGVLHAATSLDGGVGGQSGPGGGEGGRGGNRPDGSAFLAVGGVENVDAGPSDVLDPATYDQVNGEAGGGIAFPSTIDPSPSFVAQGQGGLAWPQPTSADPMLHMPASRTDADGIQFDGYYDCRTPAPGAPGGGGGHALSGLPGEPEYTNPAFLLGDITEVPASPGGDSAELAIDDTVRSLSPEQGLLRGGGGGGGGGSHIQNTQVNARPLTPDNCTFTGGVQRSISDYVAHSSAGGGGGGGALQLASGRRIILNGVIDASGGDGGSGTFPPDPPPPDGDPDLAQAGGAGAGGAVLLQSQQIQVQAIPGRINISGGEGGEGSGDIANPLGPSRGGDGGPGFLRMEASTPPSIAIEQAKLIPTEEQLRDEYGTGVAIEDIFSSAVWSPPAEGASGLSGAQSCWIRPMGNFFQLLFQEDGAEPGWDLRLRIAGQTAPQSFRGANDVFPGMTLEEAFGSDLGAAPVVVRFQGARAVGTLIDPCSVPETGVASPLAVGSLTGWVRHPSELNEFHGDPSLTPNIFRFVVIWDRSQASFDLIEALEDITVTIRPD